MSEIQQPNDNPVSQIIEELEKELVNLFESDRYKEYLDVMQRFHNYSFNNSMLIYMQNPEATHVAGFDAWKRNFDRSVKKGEKGIKIIAPAPYKTKRKVPMMDTKTKQPVYDKKGNPVMEVAEITIPAFKVVSVFDVSQTEGKELPSITKELTGTVEEYNDFMKALQEISPVLITYGDTAKGVNGYYDLEEKKIVLRKNMSQMQTLKTAIHELSHALIHDVVPTKEATSPLNRQTMEVQAESIAYTVCKHFGFDTSDYSFGYIAGWSSGKNLDELKLSMTTIQKTASTIIRGVSDKLQLYQIIDKKKQNTSQKAIAEKNSSYPSHSNYYNNTQKKPYNKSTYKHH